LKLSEAEQPAKLNSTNRRYLRDISRLPEYSWLAPLIKSLDTPNAAIQQAAASQIRAKDPELDAMLQTTVSATMLNAGVKNNVIPTTAQAQVDVRRLPNETKEEVIARFRQTINDSAIDVALAPGPQFPAPDPSAMTTPLFLAMTRAIGRTYPRDSIVPYMATGSTDGSFVRAHGMPVYGVPVFVRDAGDTRVHGNDERISPKNLEDGVELLWQIVLEIAGGGQ
jgi:acetylornithine deacetylase/succinyl-diaminopimelate desuccinylase-like protein